MRSCQLTKRLAIARKATLVAPEAELAWHYLGHLLGRLKRHDEALLAHGRAAELAPGIGAIQLRFAQAQRAVGDYDGALLTLRALSGGPMTAEARRKVVVQMLAAGSLRCVRQVRAALRAILA